MEECGTATAQRMPRKPFRGETGLGEQTLQLGCKSLVVDGADPAIPLVGESRKTWWSLCPGEEKIKMKYWIQCPASVFY